MIAVLADAGFADMQRVVLIATAENLHRAVEFVLAADERIVFTRGSLGRHVDRKLFEYFFRVAGHLLLAGIALAARGLRLTLGIVGARGRHAMRDIAQHARARDILLFKKIHGIRIALAKNAVEEYRRSRARGCC